MIIGDTGAVALDSGFNALVAKMFSVISVLLILSVVLFCVCKISMFVSSLSTMSYKPLLAGFNRIKNDQVGAKSKPTISPIKSIQMSLRILEDARTTTPEAMEASIRTRHSLDHFITLRDRFHYVTLGLPKSLPVVETSLAQFDKAEEVLVQSARRIHNRLILNAPIESVEAMIAANNKVECELRALVEQTINYLDAREVDQTPSINNLTDSIRELTNERTDDD